MYNIKEFLNFNQNCPMCQEPLSLYMNTNDNTIWKATKQSEDLISFQPDKLINPPFKKEDMAYLYKNEFDFVFSGEDFPKSIGLSLFYLCNKAGLNVKGSWSFDINAYYACYLRSSPYCILNYANDKWFNIETNFDSSNSSEIFSFKNIDKSGEKVYVLSIDYEATKTSLWYYVASDKERMDANFNPSIFDKELPMVINRPDFSNQVKLMERLDNWVLMS